LCGTRPLSSAIGQRANGEAAKEGVTAWKEGIEMKLATAKLQSVLPESGREPFAAFVADPAVRAALVRAAAARNWHEQAIEDGNIATAIDYTAEGLIPRILVVELGAPEQALADVSGLARQCGTDTAIIGIGTINDVELYRQLIQTGLTDYLVKPVDDEALDRVLDRAIRAIEGDPEEAKKGKLITVIGARGGVGASTIALNCAWLMAQEQKLHTALLDLDLYFGTSALTLDLLPGRGLREALENPSRIDSLFVASAMVNASEHLYILAGEEPLEEELLYDPAALGLLVEELRQTFARIVADLPRNMVLSYQQVLATSAEIIIVADQTLPSIRDATRLRALTREWAPQARIHLVLNRVGMKQQDNISQADFERGVEGRVNHVLPFDPKAVSAALNAGKTVPQHVPSSKIAVALRGLTTDVTGAQAAKRRGLLRRRLHLGRRARSG
jgi:pilus assembly protein CpaE